MGSDHTARTSASLNSSLFLLFMQRNGDLHCKCQQHLTLLLWMHKLLACIVKKQMGDFSTPQGLPQASPGVYLLSALRAGKLHCSCTHKSPRGEAVVFPAVYTSCFPQKSASLMPLLPAVGIWIPCIRVRELLQFFVFAHLHSCHISSQHFCRAPGISSSFWEYAG